MADKRDPLEMRLATRSTVELSDELWARLKVIASNSWKTTHKRYTRDEVIEQLLWLGIEEWEHSKTRGSEPT
jgi:predicted transcriptional regulator